MTDASSIRDSRNQEKRSEGRVVSSFIYNEKVRGVAFQILLIAVVGYIGYYLFQNVMDNLKAQNIASGFGFLKNPAGFDINQKLIAYNESSSYARVFAVGLINTLLVAFLGIILATIIGLVIGVLRLSNNWVLRTIAGAFVEITRNLPHLFHIFFWYIAVLSALPSARDSYSLFDAFFLNIRGLYIPHVTLNSGYEVVIGAAVLSIVGAVAFCAWARRHQMKTGKIVPAFRLSLLGIVAVTWGALAFEGYPIQYELPELKGFNFVGGVRLIPEFVALVVALSIYTAGFIAEIVRAGIMAISHGQTEAAYSLGLKPGLTLRLIVLPQALRVIIPPLSSQYLNLTKNSSLAVAIGYPDLVAVFSGTSLSQTGQAIEIIGITMVTYLVISLLISGFMNWYNNRVALVER